MTAVRASRLRQRWRLRMPVQTGTAANGEPVYTWQDAPRPVQFIGVEPMSSREKREARADGEHSTHRITMRYRDDISSRWRFERQGRTIEIDGIRNIRELDRVLELTGVEVKT